MDATNRSLAFCGNRDRQGQDLISSAAAAPAPSAAAAVSVENEMPRKKSSGG
jgi:hypothetical protein